MQRRGQQRSAEEIISDARRVIVACTMEWEGFTEGGKPYVLSSPNADKLFQSSPWLREQADVFVSSRANFMRASAAT